MALAGATMQDPAMNPGAFESTPNSETFRQQFAQLYGQLRQLARRELAGRHRSTLNTTLLVHEAFLKLDGPQLDVGERGPFLVLAAKAMRYVLVDHVRAALAEKRGGDHVRVTLSSELSSQTAPDGIDVLDVERGLRALEELEPRLATVVECRFYAGMEFGEIAGQLGVTERTVYRDWRRARAFLLSRLDKIA